MTSHNLRVLVLALSGLLAIECAACAADTTGVQRAAVIVPGDWTPPDTTMALSSPQYVEVVEPPPVLPLGRCDSSCPDDIWGGGCTHPACITAHPGTSELDRYIRGRWTYVRAGGTYSCRRNSNPAGCENLSVHSVGRAIDLMITEIGGDADNTAGDAVANWLIENAEYIGIQRVIWDGRYWNGSRRGAHFSDISDRLCGSRYCTDHHTNHIHVELSVDGAARRTRFFTEGAPPTTCPIVCYGTAAVRADCSYTDCAATGEVCLTDPVRCGPGAPPEPPEAVRNAGVAMPAVAAIADLSRFQPTPPTRLFDTRSESGAVTLMRSDGATSGPLGATRSARISGIPGLPSAATGLWLNVAAVPISTPGFVSVFPTGALTSASTLNFAATRVRANGTAVALGAGGDLTITASSEVHVIADMTGSFAPTGLGLRTAGPLRVLDTRALGVRLVAGEPFPVDVHAPADARGVVASVAALQSGVEAGFLTAFPCGATVPMTSNINFAPTSVTANTVISELGAGQLCFVSNVAVDLIVDVTGYLVPDGELSFQALSPVRILDTRQDTSLYTGRLGAGQTIELPLQSAPGIPADVRAAVVNITTLSPGTRGFVTAFPCGSAVPGTSSLNFDADDPIAAVSVSATGAGSLCVFSASRTHLIVDLLGVWVPTPGAPPPTDGPGPLPEEPDDMMMPPAGVDAGGTDPEDSGVPDGVEAGVDLDGGRSPRDAGRGAGLNGTCGCRASVPRGGHTALALALALGLAWSRRRQRR
ncbi:MAG: hypothetical protein KA761_15140 [Gemmatimonadaceae bacterium]|nr:hypothetical protein [Gemmatimonadaceae bacterium]